MAIQVADNFSYQGKKPLDGRTEYGTIAAMVAVSESILNDGCLAYVKENKKYYTFDSNNTIDSTLGKWREFESGSTITVDPTPTSGSTNAVQSGGTYTALEGKVDKVTGKQLSTEDFTTAEKTKLDGINLSNYIPTSQKGANSGVAELDANGKVPSTQLPSYVDDVVSKATKSEFPNPGEDDKIYIAKDENASYRWDGTEYVSISSANGLTLGETSSTAYRGDRGKTAYDDSQTNKTNIGTMANLTTTEKTNLVGAVNEVNGGLANKVDKVSGKGLSTEDYTTAEKTKLSGLSNTPIATTSVAGKVIPDGTSIDVDSDGTIHATGTGHTIEDSTGVDMTARANLQFVGATVSDDSTNDRTIVTVDTSGKADKVSGATNGNLASLDNNGNLADSGSKASDFATTSDLDEKENAFRLSTMPTASSTNVGQIIQYTGETTQTYTNGYFYKCVAQGTDPETYAWEQTKVQSDPIISGIASENISEMNVEFSTDYSVKRVYVIVDDGFEVQPFSTASWDNITEALKRHYAGELDITDYYNLGETKTITVSAMSEDIARQRTYAQQDVKFKIVGFNYYSLETSIGDSTKSALVLHTEDCLEASSNLLAMDSTLDKTRAWETCDRRNWLRGTFYNALPQGVKSNIKTITHDVREGMVDDASNTVTLSETVFLPTKEEVTYSEGGLPYYNSSESLIKGVGNTSKVNYYLSSCFVSQNARFYDIVGNNGSFGNCNAKNDTSLLCCIAPMICM